MKNFITIFFILFLIISGYIIFNNINNLNLFKNIENNTKKFTNSNGVERINYSDIGRIEGNSELLFNGWCYQENADSSNSCGGLNTGIYFYDGDWTEDYKSYDGNWETYSNAYNLGNLYVNYTKPARALSTSKWQFKYEKLTALPNPSINCSPDDSICSNSCSQVFKNSTSLPWKETVDGCFDNSNIYGIAKDSNCDEIFSPGNGDCSYYLNILDIYSCPSYNRKGVIVNSSDCICINTLGCTISYTNIFNFSSSYFSGGGYENNVYNNNFTIPQSCWDYDSNKLSFKIVSDNKNSSGVYINDLSTQFYCYDGSYKLLNFSNGNSVIYEEAMNWAIS